ncbi:MAG: hypothetical protein EAZ77_08600 [Nostocales cyanobacterium]|nr:MAG: hypothetical protein EAZ77_08600 [Nostocales cyanobacterium]
MKFVQLPSGDHINLALAHTVEFGTFKDGNDVSHQRCKIIWGEGDSVIYCDNVAMFIKDYLDQHNGLFLIHEQDHAVQSLALGLAIEIIQSLSGESQQEISDHIIEISTKRVNQLSPEQIQRIRKSYEDNFGTGKGAVSELIKLNENTQTSPATL